MLPLTTAPNGQGGQIRTLFAGNRIPPSRINSIASKVISRYPQANQPGDTFTNANNYFNVVPAPYDGDNYSLRIDPNFRKHPIGVMFDRGVKVTINTDDPPFFHTTMAREYEMLNQAFDWDEGVFAKIARTALDAAFCDADTKTRILKILEQANG